MIYFYKGKMVMRTAMVSSDPKSVIVRVLSIVDPKATDHPVNTELYAKLAELEKPIYEVFELHANVKTKGTMTGIIVGFEPSTNRAVVMSDKIGNYAEDRTRYSYKQWELLTHNPNAFEFVPGKFYKVNGKETLFCVADPTYPEDLILYDANGKAVYDSLASIVDKTGLQFSHGIQNVQVAKAFN